MLYEIRSCIPALNLAKTNVHFSLESSPFAYAGLRVYTVVCAHKHKYSVLHLSSQ